MSYSCNRHVQPKHWPSWFDWLPWVPLWFLLQWDWSGQPGGWMFCWIPVYQWSCPPRTWWRCERTLWYRTLLSTRSSERYRVSARHHQECDRRSWSGRLLSLPSWILLWVSWPVWAGWTMCWEILLSRHGWDYVSHARGLQLPSWILLRKPDSDTKGLSTR